MKKLVSQTNIYYQNKLKIDWDKQAREQDKVRLEELKKQELEVAPEAADQAT